MSASWRRLVADFPSQIWRIMHSTILRQLPFGHLRLPGARMRRPLDVRKFQLVHYADGAPRGISVCFAKRNFQLRAAPFARSSLRPRISSKNPTSPGLAVLSRCSRPITFREIPPIVGTLLYAPAPRINLSSYSYRSGLCAKRLYIPGKGASADRVLAPRCPY